MLIILLAFLAVLVLLEQPQLLRPPPDAAWVLPAAIAAYLVVAAMAAGMNTLASLRVLDRRGEQAWSLVMRRHRAWATGVYAWLLAGLVALIVTGLGHVVLSHRILGRLPLAAELAVLSPFVAALLLAWIADYPFYRAVRVRIVHRLGEGARVGVWSLGEYLDYNLRHQLLFVAVPVSMIVAATDAMRFYLYPVLPAWAADQVVLTGSIAVGAAVFLISPLLIVRIWRTERLPPGELRENLQALCRRLRVRCRDILVWRSGHTVANAGMMGLIGPVRYVLLTDALLANLDLRGVQAIFAHEAGHIIHHHIPYTAIFAVAVMGICGAAGDMLAAGADLSPWWAQGLTLGLLVPSWAWGFGWISRLFERQSDVAAAALVGSDHAEQWKDQPITQLGATTFAMALQRVAQLNGTWPYHRNWRHGSIAQRVGYVLWLCGTGGSPANVGRLVRRVKAALLAALAVAVILIVRDLIR
jgi:STE24 endopeptidase